MAESAHVVFTRGTATTNLDAIILALEDRELNIFIGLILSLLILKVA